MPLYPCKCKCGHEDEVFLSISEYDKLPEHCGEQMQRVFTPLHVIEDTKPYQSPLDGKWISSKSQHRKHMREHGVIEVGNEKLTRPISKPYNPGNIKQDLAEAYDQLTQG